MKLSHKLHLSAFLVLAFAALTLAQRGPGGRAQQCGNYHVCEENDYLITKNTSKGCYCDRICDVYSDCCANSSVPDDAEWMKDFETIQYTSECSSLHDCDYVEYDYYITNKCPKDYTDQSIR